MDVIVEPFNVEWANLFRRESRVVADALGGVSVGIHHIGSTAIPNIHAKPIIDMLIEVSSLEQADTRQGYLEGYGYEAMGEFGIPGRRYYRKQDESGANRYQLHAFVAGSQDVDRHLAFRDFMSAHADPAKQYADLKCRLARQYPHDIDRYQDGKEEFIKIMEQRALEWRSSQ